MKFYEVLTHSCTKLLTLWVPSQEQLPSLVTSKCTWRQSHEYSKHMWPMIDLETEHMLLVLGQSHSEHLSFSLMIVFSLLYILYKLP